MNGTLKEQIVVLNLIYLLINFRLFIIFMREKKREKRDGEI